MLGYNFSCPIQIRWSDLDPLGHVNNATFVTYFEIARGRFMIEACPDWNWKKDMFLIGNVNVDFRKEMTLYAQNAAVQIRTTKLGTKSFVLEYQITSIKNGETIIHATGTTTQVMFDMKTRSTITLPNWVRESLEKFDSI